MDLLEQIQHAIASMRRYACACVRVRCACIIIFNAVGVSNVLMLAEETNAYATMCEREREGERQTITWQW